MNTKKNIFTIVLLIGIIFIISNVSGQDLHERKSYPIPPNSFLEKYYKDNGIDLEKLASQPVLQKTTAWNFLVGSTHIWYAINESGKGANPETVHSTCREVGTHCYIFVQDSLWTNGSVTQAAVDSVRNAWDFKTPANPNKGIYQTDVETFGNPPNVDNDSLIVILILNILDGYTGNGGYIAGYFDPSNESQLGNNRAEILFIDANPQDLNSSSGLQDAMSTTAHEFQHMIEYHYNGGSQPTFFNEGCSVIAEYINCYPLYDQPYFNSEVNHSLLNWRNNDNINVLYDYSRAARFFLYLKEQFFDGNKTFFRNFVTATNQTGIPALNSALSFISSRRFADIIPDWFTANYLNDTTINSKWGYKYPNLSKVASNIQLGPNVQLTTGNVYALSAQYVSFINGQNLAVNFSGITNSNVLVREFNISPGPKNVIDGSTMSNAFGIANAGTGSALSNNVTFMIYDASTSEDSTIHSNYSYTSTGSTGNSPYQLMYDQTEPAAAQYGTLTVGDSVAVVFDGVNIPEAKLDSIRVALRQAGSLSGNVYRYSGSSLPTPIGKKLTTNPISAKSNIAIRPPSNYPVPWNNWVKVDLTSLNIDATTGFVVSFGMNGNYTGTNSGDNRIMVTEMPGTTAFHSYEKLQTPRNGTSGVHWHGAVDSLSQIVLVYLIRAYVSFPGTNGVQQTVELTPAAYKLGQNYPNPFNPTTAISYQLPAYSHVSLKVYDVLGREVATLVNENKPAGNYTAHFNASKLVSGFYFYRMDTDSFVQTKKMILMK
jgi:Secretion system C-terminal sorting domain